jgi:hypothetical protein
VINARLREWERRHVPNGRHLKAKRSCNGRSKNKIIENDRAKKGACKVEWPEVEASNRFKAEAGEPLVGEGPYRVDVSGERIVYERRFDDRVEPGVEEDVAERPGVRDENVEPLHQPGWP